MLTGANPAVAVEVVLEDFNATVLSFLFPLRGLVGSKIGIVQRKHSDTEVSFLLS